MNNAPANTMLKSDLDFDANVNLAPQNTAQLGAQQNVKKSIKSLGVMEKARQNSNEELCLFDVKEVCAMLHIGRSTLYSLISSGKLRPAPLDVKRILFTRESLKNYIKILNEGE